jgi:hypothetical protein
MTTPVLRVRGKYPTEPGGKPVAPSVSTIVGQLDKPGLSWGAAKESALFAVHHRNEWEELDPLHAVDRIRKHHKGVWDDKAARGTAVHAMAVEWSEGHDVDVTPECSPYMDALERFYDDHQPRWLHVERSVVYTEPRYHSYGGSFDWIAELNDGRRVLGDWKTGGRYPVDTILQLAAYRYAQHLCVVDDVGRFVGLEPMPSVDAAAVVYLHDDGTYELLELPATRDAHGTFLRLRDVWTWRQQAEQWNRSHPFIPPREAA